MLGMVDTEVNPISTITTRRSLAAYELAGFAERGYAKLRDVIDPEQLEYFGPLITEQVIALNTQHLPLGERDTYGKAFLQVGNIWEHDERIAAFVCSRDLARFAAELLGVRSVRLYHDQALYKEPSGGITPWHADQYYWPFDSGRCCTAWIPLQDTGPEMGPLSFWAGSQRFVQGRDLPISDESEARIAELVTQQGFELDDAPFRLGDVSYHLGWTFHGARANRGAEPRRVMTIIYMDADMKVAEPVNEAQNRDRRKWFSGLPVGHVTDGPLHPVLF